MPIMSGVECTLDMRNNEKENSEMSSQQKYKMLPAIAMVTNAVHDDQENFLQAGLDDYRTNSIKRDELFGVLAKWNPEDRALRRVREDLFNGRYSQARRNNIKDRKNNSKDRRQIDREYALPHNLPGIDLAQGLARVDGNTMLYTRVLQMFVTDYTSIGHRIETALNDNKLASVEGLVHTVKGVAGTIGAQGLAKAALALEKCTKKEKQIHEELAQFKEVLQLTMSSLATLPCITQSVETTNKKNQSGDDEKIANLFTELQTMLSEKNFQVESKWQQLKTLLQTVPEKKRLQLDYAISNAEFERALEILTEIIYLTAGCTAAPTINRPQDKSFSPTSSAVSLLSDLNT